MENEWVRYAAGECATKAAAISNLGAELADDLKTVFNKQEREALAAIMIKSEHGKIDCGLPFMIEWKRDENRSRDLLYRLERAI